MLFRCSDSACDRTALHRWGDQSAISSEVMRTEPSPESGELDVEGLVNKAHARATGKSHVCLFGMRTSQQHVPYSQAPSTLVVASILSQVASRLRCRMSLAAFVYVGFCKHVAFRHKYSFVVYKGARNTSKHLSACSEAPEIGFDSTYPFKL